MSADFKRLPADWSKDLGITVLDDDGWRADGQPWGIAITEQDFRRRAAMSTMREVATPAPLDPSKVKAGDTVTLQDDKASVDGEVQDVEYRFGGERVVKLHHSWFRIEGDGAWTLTAHQPAPEPEPAPDDPEVIVGDSYFRLSEVPAYAERLLASLTEEQQKSKELYIALTEMAPAPEPEPEYENGAVIRTAFSEYHMIAGEFVDIHDGGPLAGNPDVRPLVVIDPADVDVDALLDSALARLSDDPHVPTTYTVLKTALSVLGIEATR